MLMRKEPKRLDVIIPRNPQPKRKYRKKKVKTENWMITVPPFLDRELKEFITRNNSSRINFIRKCIRILCEDDPPQQNRKRRKQWLIQLHPSLHKKAIEVVKANYPSKTAFIRFAVERQLTAEIYMDEKTKDLLIDNRKMRNKITKMESDKLELEEKYYDLLRDFRKLQNKKTQQANESSKICAICQKVLESV